MKKIGIIGIIIILFCSYHLVYAAPDSSKGFAEYDDITAEEESQQKEEEQKREQETTIGKSNNNYLDNLEVEGYKLSPSFDKQTLEYVLEGEIKSKEITILAIPSDERARIEGSGKITLDTNQKECRIDVVAESGTVRTYKIYLGEQAKVDSQNQTLISSEDATQVEETSAEPEENNNIVVVGILFSIVIVFILLLGFRNKKSKRNKRRK